MLNPYTKLRALAAAIRTLWRTYVVAHACSNCDEQGRQKAGTRFIEAQGWLCSPCARALGVPAADRDDR